MTRTLRDEKILVTGCGFVGKNLLPAMQQRGYTNIRLTDLRRPENLPKGIEFVESDLTDKASLERAVEGCYAIVHTAALFDFFASWERLYAVNVEGTRNICEAAIEKKVKKMVMFSSGSIYKVGENLKEDSPIDPVDPYALSKFLAENVAANYNGINNFNIALLRPAVIFGKGGDYGAGKIFLTQALTAKLLGMKLLPGEGKFKGCYVHVGDVVGAALHIYEHTLFTNSRNPADMAFNINADDAVSPFEIAQMADGAIEKTGLAKLISEFVPEEKREITVTRPMMEFFANVCTYAVNALRAVGILGKDEKLRAMLEPGQVKYTFLSGHLKMDNSKIRKYGYEPKHTCMCSMPAVMRGYDRQGWDKLLF
ncbi:MAG: NAD(P)-dependent oxidoreductase [Nanoarchaeota archaeon]|nr:NAD(P)-dependent oxidoreductase [Nanoarchaeota archaeon]